MQEQLVPEAIKTNHLLPNDIVGVVFANVVSGNITHAPERLRNEVTLDTRETCPAIKYWPVEDDTSLSPSPLGAPLPSPMRL